ncbi:MAG TPA: ThuA domain-containing protein [Acidobacteriota bacterium]|nr:ThuA domain-containing protein [Acidobacteriota bacterium]
MRSLRLVIWLGVLGLFPASFSCLANEGAKTEARDRFFTPDKLRALVLTGRNNHDWRRTSQRLKQLLSASGRFDVRVVEEPAGVTQHTLAPYNVVILDYQGPRLGQATEQALSDFVRSGGGLVAVHAAGYAFTGLDVLADGHRPTGLREEPWEEYWSLVGGIWSEKDPKTGHGRRHTFAVRVADPAHPIVRGMSPELPATDELFHNLKMHPSAHVVATAYSAPETGGTGKDEPVLWVTAYGSGRVFCTTLGHDLVAMAEPGFVNTFLRGTEWAASGDVTLPAEIPLGSGLAEVPRVLVVTGGHEYDTGFYELFAGEWIRWWHATSNTEAFRDPIRDKFDVVLLYDMSRELSEAGRSHLREFLESGKGLVVLHHALADYDTWEWWGREVVGARYIQEGNGQPASTYRHDVELKVQAVAEHPITQDLGPFHYVDETYKDMWFSPDIRVLMKTDAETSDGPVVWIGPYERSRVVVIQLGHDDQAFRYPGFRELVRRSIAWAAGRQP